MPEAIAEKRKGGRAFGYKNKKTRTCDIPLDALLMKCEPVPESGCLIWFGAASNRGYGMVVFPDRTGVPAHRFVYMKSKGLAHDFLPSDLMVRHTCDVKCCVNPDHLVLGLAYENVHDAIRRGLHPRAFRVVDGTLRCRKGHDVSYVDSVETKYRKGYVLRHCRECYNDNKRMRYHMKKEEALSA